MVYLTYNLSELGECSEISRIWLSDHEDLEDQYREFVLKESLNRGIIINKHWLNIMNHEDHHKKMSEKEYDWAKRGWTIFLGKNNFDKFLGESKLAVEQHVEHIFF